jgi:hypothetical protein
MGDSCASATSPFRCPGKPACFCVILHNGEHACVTNTFGNFCDASQNPPFCPGSLVCVRDSGACGVGGNHGDYCASLC